MFAKCLLLLLLLAASRGVAASDMPDEAVEQAQRALLGDAKTLLLEDGDVEPALVILDGMLEHYAALYPQGETRWYVARNQSETLANLVRAAAQHDRGVPGPPSSRVIQASWGDALYYKGYALIEQGRLAEAKLSLQEAISLSPYNSMYHAQIGHIHQVGKDWDAALAAFRAAEDAVSFSPAAAQRHDSGRAKRGIAYCLIELQRLDEARVKLEEALELDPEDARAAESLKYVRQLKARTTGG